MPGADGAPVKVYRRAARNAIAGDWLPDYGAHVVAVYAGPDPDTGREVVWLTLSDGSDVELTRRAKVWIHRTYAAPEWVAAATSEYRDARHAWEALRESSAPIPAGAVAGAAGSSVSYCQLEEADYRAAFPVPRLAAFLRDHAARRREPVTA